ncbi:hypothetical protein [Burkholderia vietnamiensis]|uniref:hypothetical protein n=1 Tax=Burkholderia vietnamiensis TaxID=60552 RepID=UPI001593AC6E|nr:hypothetical protein [Burkholderia vietnamiensis]
MSFLTDAQEILAETEYNKLRELQRKSADFEATRQEEAELMDLKQQVYDGVAKRDREKNLSFLAGKAYPLEDVISAGGYSKEDISLVNLVKNFGITKEDWDKATKTLFPPETKNAIEVAQYKVGDKTETLKMYERASSELSDVVKKGGIKGFAQHATNIEWLTEFSVPDRGPHQGKKNYKNAGEVALRFKWDKNELVKAILARAEKEAKNAPKAEEAETKA